MSYRGAQYKRFNQAFHSHVLSQAGHTALWRQYISASAGVSFAGFGSAESYREQMITAIIGQGVVATNTEQQRGAGMLAEGTLRITTQQRLASEDEIIWRGVRYSVETESQPSLMDGTWMATIVRRDT